MISTVVARAILTLERSECVWDKRHTPLSRHGFEPLPLVTGTASKARRKCILMLICGDQGFGRYGGTPRYFTGATITPAIRRHKRRAGRVDAFGRT
jgi:hypothetical protein